MKEIISIDKPILKTHRCECSCGCIFTCNDSDIQIFYIEDPYIWSDDIIKLEGVTCPVCNKKLYRT